MKLFAKSFKRHRIPEKGDAKKLSYSNQQIVSQQSVTQSDNACPHHQGTVEKRFALHPMLPGKTERQ
ncbi:hypothetical protein [Novacetimonas cocois]|uniref:hypothetical protein n=1 Tax=Novacetimonas cocois TaxID=1747507 RepID=UPI001057C151|nr:hypothetical protein [Novacetimonas cocois]